MSGSWIFTATSRSSSASPAALSSATAPAVSRALCTSPIDATARGSSSQRSKTSSKGRPSSRAAMARASPGPNSVGQLSCVSLHHAMYCGGTNSSRVLMSWAFLR